MDPVARLPAADDGAYRDVHRPELLELPRALSRSAPTDVSGHMRGEAHGLAAIVIVCRDTRRQGAFGVDSGETVGCTPVQDGRSSHSRPTARTALGARPGAGDAAACGAAGDGLAAARLRADAVVGEGARTIGASTLPSGPRPRGLAATSQRSKQRKPRPRCRASAREVTPPDGSTRPLRRCLPPLRVAGERRPPRLAPFHLLAAESGVYSTRPRLAP